jgi:predicted metalloprotease with PDZ domain
MHYKLYIKNPAAHYLYIDMTISNNKEENLHVQLPAWRPGRYELGNFAKNIKKFDAFNEKGELLEWTKTNKDLWIVKTKGASEVKLTYSYYASELNAGSTYVDATQMYCNPVNCCMYVPGRMEEEHQLELAVPENYTVATSMKKRSEHQLIAASYEELADSPFIASADIKTLSLKIEGIDFFLHFNGECNPDMAQLEKDFVPFIKESVHFYEGIHVSDYHFLFQVLPVKFYHGVEHTKNTVIGIGPGYHLMEGNTYEDLLGVSCHELFHTWNVKSIRPVEMFPYDYTKENYARTGYVYEGITTYYGDKLLFTSKVFSEKQYFTTLEERLNKHFHNFGRFNLSVTESSWENWLDGYTPGAPYRKVSIYDEGNLIAFMLDVLILEATGNKKSLRDVMLVLYNEFYKKGKGYSEQDILSIVHNVSGKDFDAFFKKYVYGLEEYEEQLQQCFAYLGLQMTKTAPVAMYEKHFGFKSIEHGIHKKITLIVPYSPAWKAGMSVNDEILAVNGFQLKNDLNTWLQYFYKKGDAIRLTVLSNHELKDIHLTVDAKKEFLHTWHVSHVNNAAEAVKNNYNHWKSTYNK